MEKKIFIWMVIITTLIIGIFFALSKYTLLCNSYATSITTIILLFASMPANKSKNFDIIAITIMTALVAMFALMAIIAIFWGRASVASISILGAIISFLIMFVFGVGLQIQKSKIFIPVAVEFTIIITTIIVIANHYCRP